MDNNNHLHGLNFIFISLSFIFVDIFSRVFNIVFALQINLKIASKADKDKIIMLKFIVISILRVNWLLGSNSSYIKHRTQQYMYNSIDQYNLTKKICSQKHQLVCQSTFHFILVLTWSDHVGHSNRQLKLFEKNTTAHTRTHTHTQFFGMTIHHCMNLYHPTNNLLTIWPFWCWLVSSCFAGG